MLAYIARRLLWTPVLLLAVSLFVFVLGEFGPGDPVEVALGQRYTEERAQRIREQRGLNDFVVKRYFRYVGNALQGDFGESYRADRRPVSDLLGPKLWISARLFFAGFIVSVVLGVPLGFFAATRQGSWMDPAIVSTTLVLLAMPVFILAPALIVIFAQKLEWVPVSGWGGFWDTRIILPALTIGLPSIAVMTRMMRASTLDVLGQDYVRTARAKGLGELTVRRRHVARNALIPIVTILGFSIAGMLGGALIVELIFGIPGVGRLALDAIFARDFPIITALALIGATSLVIANLLVDILYAVVDPRITYR